MITRDEIRTRLIEEIADLCTNVDVEVLKKDLRDEMQWHQVVADFDSLDLLELVITMEDVYKIELADETLDNMTTVGSLLGELEAALHGRN